MNLKKKNEDSDQSLEEDEEEEDEHELFNDDNFLKNKNEHINGNISDKNIFIISLKLLKKFNEMNNDDNCDNVIIDYISKIGLPLDIKNEKLIYLFLYFFLFLIC